MLTLSAKIRKDVGKNLNSRRREGKIPAVIYGPGVKNLPLEINREEFEKIFKETGESSLVSLEIDGEKKKRLVLIHEIQKDPLTGKFLHVDFYQAPLKEEVEATVPLVFEGTSPAVKELEGTLVKNIIEVEVKALPQNLPHEIKVNIEKLKTFEDHILIRDLIVPKTVKILKEPEEIVASVTPPEKVEEELAEPIEEKVEEVEKVEEKKEEEEKVPTADAPEKEPPPIAEGKEGKEEKKGKKGKKGK
jgi:large subunit ribosomal protein L25